MADEFLNELHNEELLCFKQLMLILEKYNITWYAIGGTLLGSVRHKGFIPWDDDIDIGVLRKDYEKLAVILKEELPEPYVLDFFRYTGIVNEMQCYFMRIRSTEYEIEEVLTDANDVRTGFFLDIIPIDGTPNSTIKRKFYYMHVLFLRFLGGASHAQDGIRSRRPVWEKAILGIIRLLRISSLINTEKVYKSMDRLFMKYDALKSDYSGTITGIYKTREIVRSEYFGFDKKPVLLDFEDTKIRAPYMYDEYLKHMFGDYMTPPKDGMSMVHYRKKEQHA